MSVFKRDELGTAPEWVEVKDFEAIYLDQHDAQNGIREFIPMEGMREILVVISGEMVVEWAGGRVTLRRRDWMELPREEFTVSSARYIQPHYPCEAIKFAGTWNEVNMIGIWHFRPDKPLEVHYHDFNEYWFVFRGSFRGVFDDREVQLEPGDMLATRMGHEHGIPEPPGVVEGIGFSTERMGQRRQGHLHREEHGEPVPL